VAKALQSASSVFLAVVKSVSHTAISGDSSGRYVTEVATFEVLEGWKGKRPGETVVMRSNIGPGPCGISAVNDPLWLEEAGTPVKFSGVWLIYAYGSEPYELSMSTRSVPIDVGGARDLVDLYRLAKPLRPQIASGMDLTTGWSRSAMNKVPVAAPRRAAQPER
jgi:hypothetical protein